MATKIHCKMDQNAAKVRSNIDFCHKSNEYLVFPCEICKKACPLVASIAADIRVVTQCSSPTNGCSLELCIPFLKLTNKNQAFISWKPGPLAANVTRNMIGAAANSYMRVVGSH